MRLKKIKLCGFKSFVDATTIPMPSNLTGIVGPNGCGKSNVIDAVRWVLGESSAKHLRGGSIADVIFDGTTQRKPLGQASVELVFDNSDGRVAGEFANYNELSIKRVIGRDGVSHYYLNGTKCRRKDITHIFLGTGLGPRSYAIIEQGMISRFIDAKPDEMRVYIEEAAGISKYKDRRRETQLRIKHTLENLERVNDLKEEVGKQLEKLKKQARDAEVYQNLSKELEKLKAELNAIKFRDIEKTIQGHKEQINKEEVAKAALDAKKTDVAKQLEAKRAEHQDLNDRYQSVHDAHYDINTDILKLEQTIASREEKLQSLQQEIHQIEVDIKSSTVHLQDDEKKILENQAILDEIQPNYAQVKTDYEQAKASLLKIEEEKQLWEQRNHGVQSSLSEQEKQLSVEQMRQEQIRTRKADMIKRLEHLREKLSDDATGEVQQEIDHLEQEVAREQAEHGTLKEALNRLIQKEKDYKVRLVDTKRELRDAEKSQQQKSVLSATLKAQQQATQQQGLQQDWLSAHELHNKPRLVEALNIQHGYERCVETVFADSLQSICLAHVSAPDLAGFEGGLSMMDTTMDETVYPEQHLLSKLHPVYQGMKALFSDVYVAEDLPQAQALLSDLSPHASVVTKSGIWLGHGWLRLQVPTKDQISVLERQAQIDEIAETLMALDQTLIRLERDSDALNAKLQAVDEEIASQRSLVSEKESMINEIRSSLNVKKSALKAQEQQRREIQTEVHDLDGEVAKCTESLSMSEEKASQCDEQLIKLRAEQSELQQSRTALDDELQAAKAVTQRLGDEHHELAIKVHALQAEVDSLKQNKVRLDTHIQSLHQRERDLRQQLGDIHSTAELKTKLQQQLEEKVHIERSLEQLREQLHERDESMADLDKASHGFDIQINEFNNKLQGMYLEIEGKKARAQSFKEQLDNGDYELEALLEQLSDDASESAWSDQITQISNRIGRMGAINLAAIEEYKTESERFEYLSSQYDDLTGALETLEETMRKIDQETKTRFKQTFEDINKHFALLFPKLFGGGHAELQLTEQDILETGVRIIAKPPGKKVSNIAALSGGEKALTAVSLVLAIFQLNPSPFCMLDEVDAPLDDANVTRYCKVIKEMSNDVQFIFITHNKVTMELAEQLSGVTMNEPGVSRMVSVDIEQALEHATQ